MVSDVETKLRKKTEQLQRFVSEEFVYDPNAKVSYYDSDFQRKELSGQYSFNVRHKNNGVYSYPNALSSALYIPVIQVNNSTPALTDISWTSWINRTATPDFNHFIGTINGLLAFYPAIEWPQTYDMYDCRLQSWFLQAASTRHDIALLIDRSGSVSGLTLRNIERIAKLLLNVIPEIYWFNVFLFNNDTVPLIPCYGSHPLPAKDEIKKLMVLELSNIEASMPGYLDLALRKLQSTFFNTSASTDEGHCKHKRLIILFTDGMIDFSTSNIKAILRDMNVQLIVLDFSSPISPGRNKKLMNMACDVGEHYLFVKRISDWFKVADIFFNTTVSFEVTLGEGRITKRIPIQWSDPITTFYNKKSVILSLPVFNKTKGSPLARLIGVMGTEINLDKFTNMIPREYGSLMYDVITYKDMRVIQHPRLQESLDIPYLDQIEPSSTNAEVFPDEQLYPKADIESSAVTKMYKIITKRSGRLVYMLHVPQNDGYVLVYGNDVLLQHKNLDYTIRAMLGKRMYIKKTAYHYYNFAEDSNVNIFNKCDSKYRTKSLKQLCKEYNNRVVHILNDIVIVNDTVNTWWNQKQQDGSVGSLSNYLYTRNGMLYTNSKDSNLKNPDPISSQEWVDFATNPDKFPKDALLVTNNRNGYQVNLTKSVLLQTSDNNTIVHSIVGTTLRSRIFEQIIRRLLYMYDIEDTTIKSVLLDHKGYVVFSSHPTITPLHIFYGEANYAVFQIMLHRGYYIDKVFRDCLPDCSLTYPLTSSSFRTLSFLTSNILWSIVTYLQTLALAILRQLHISYYGIPPSSSFIKPEIKTKVTRCCRDVHTYERDFSVTNMFVNSYNRCDEGDSCIDKVAVLSIERTNLLLVAIIPHERCYCTTRGSYHHGSTQKYEKCSSNARRYINTVHTNNDMCYKDSSTHANTGECSDG